VKWMRASDAKVGMIWHLSNGDMLIERIKPLGMPYGAHVEISGTVTRTVDGTTYHETSSPLPVLDYYGHFSERRQTAAGFKQQLMDATVQDYATKAVKLAQQMTKGVLTSEEFYHESTFLLMECQNALYAINPNTEGK
jgi:hypothetical protein